MEDSRNITLGNQTEWIVWPPFVDHTMPAACNAVDSEHHGSSLKRFSNEAHGVQPRASTTPHDPDMERCHICKADSNRWNTST